MRTKLDFETVKTFSFFCASDLEEGERYQYKEDSHILDVIYNGGYIDPEKGEIVLNLTNVNTKEQFDITQTTDPKYKNWCYSGMFRLYDDGTYFTCRR
jgi:hypothetical protein